MLEVFEVLGFKNGYELGFLIGQKFSNLIRDRVTTDLILQKQLLPFARSTQSKPLIQSLSDTNRNKFPQYWDELVGMADGSGVSFLDIMLLNFRKEILPFIPKMEISETPYADTNDDCSDVLVLNESMALVAHNEDANFALLDHVYLITAKLENGVSFTAYTYAGELPSCAFGFNSHGIAFTLDSVPPSQEEIVPGGIGRNFVSRDLLEATSIDDALNRIRSSDVSVGHCYNLVDLKRRKIVNVETASKNRTSIYEIEKEPFFHANMYLHLKLQQVHDENSMRRQKRAEQMSKLSKYDILSLLGDSLDTVYPIYMTGPILHTLCTALIDLNEKTLSIIEGNPKLNRVTHVFHLS